MAPTADGTCVAGRTLALVPRKAAVDMLSARVAQLESRLATVEDSHVFRAGIELTPLPDSGNRYITRGWGLQPGSRISVSVSSPWSSTVESDGTYDDSGFGGTSGFCATTIVATGTDMLGREVRSNELVADEWCDPW